MDIFKRIIFTVISFEIHSIYYVFIADGFSSFFFGLPVKKGLWHVSVCVCINTLSICIHQVTTVHFDWK